MKKSKIFLAVSSTLLSLGASEQLHAADNEADHRGLEQIIVSARRVDENVQDVPLAITAMSAEQLEKAGVTNVAALAQKAPSVQMTAAVGRKEASFFTIRGQRADDILLTSDQAVAVIVGGVPLNWSYGVGQTGTLDVSSLEVAKGPQGTLFGKNSTGGAIIISPAEPDQSFAGKVKAGIGNYDLRTLEGMVNTPLTDTLAMRVAASMVKQDGLEENLDGGNDFNSTDQWTARASLKWQPTDEFSHLLVVEGGYSSSSGGYAKPLTINPTPSRPYAVAVSSAFLNAIANDGFFEGHSDAPHGSYSDLKTWGVLNTTTFDVSDTVTIKNILGVRDLAYKSAEDLDGINAFDVPSPAGRPAGWWQFTSEQFTYGRSITEELQIIGSADIADWIAGIYYGHMDGKDGSRTRFTPLPVLTTYSITGPAGGIVNQTIAAFAQSSWHLTDRLNLTTGARITKDDREVIYNSQSLLDGSCQIRIGATGGIAVPSPCEIEESKSFHEPTWNLSLDYKLTDTQMIYAAARHGYRSGGFPGRGGTPDTTASFDPEKVNDYEIGYKFDGDAFGMPLRVNTAVFYQAYHDVQRNITLTDSVTRLLTTSVRNAGKATVSGGEVEFTVLPVDSLELSGYVTYVDAHYDKWEDGGVDRAANDFASVPEKTAGATARYTLPLPASVGEVSVAANVYWQDAIALYVDNVVDNTGAECVGGGKDFGKSYRLYNASIDWEAAMGIDALSFSAWGKNLSNEEYFNSGLCLYNQLQGMATAYIGDPRTFGITAQYKF